MILALVLVFSYLLGAVPFGYIVARLVSGRDIRTMGSGNIGATNVSRCIGRGWGRLVLGLDMLKGFVPPLAAGMFNLGPKFIVLSGVMAVLGHMFPVYIGFRGGKGVATGLGALLGISVFCHDVFWSLLLFLGVWWVVHRVSGYVSLASISGAGVFALYGLLHFEDIWLKIFALAIGILVIVRHRSNILNLIRGKEKKANL